MLEVCFSCESKIITQVRSATVVLYNADLSSADLQRVLFDTRTLLDGAAFSISSADLQRSFFRTGPLLHDSAFSDGKSKSASVADISWGGVNLTVVDWVSVKKLGDEYKARGSNGKFDYQLAVRANRQLAVVLRDQGLNEEADRFAYHAQLLQRIVWSKQQRPLKYIFSLFLDLLAGYGFRPGRTLLWYILVIVGFAITYAHFEPLPRFPDSVVFSLMSFHGRGFFPSLNGETTLHNPLVIVAAIEAIVGLFIEISFIATFTQRFFGR